MLRKLLEFTEVKDAESETAEGKVKSQPVNDLQTS